MHARISTAHVQTAARTDQHGARTDRHNDVIITESAYQAGITSIVFLGFTAYTGYIFKPLTVLSVSVFTGITA